LGWAPDGGLAEGDAPGRGRRLPRDWQRASWAGIPSAGGRLGVARSAEGRSPCRACRRRAVRRRASGNRVSRRGSVAPMTRFGRRLVCDSHALGLDDGCSWGLSFPSWLCPAEATRQTRGRQVCRVISSHIGRFEGPALGPGWIAGADSGLAQSRCNTDHDLWILAQSLRAPLRSCRRASFSRKDD
jgi:hypothetical protein